MGSNWGGRGKINRDVKEALVEALDKMAKSMWKYYKIHVLVSEVYSVVCLRRINFF